MQALLSHPKICLPSLLGHSLVSSFVCWVLLDVRDGRIFLVQFKLPIFYSEVEGSCLVLSAKMGYTNNNHEHVSMYPIFKRNRLLIDFSFNPLTPKI